MYLPKPAPGARVLDVGCGRTPYADALLPPVRAGRLQYTGIDPEPRAAAPELPVAAARAEDLQDLSLAQAWTLPDPTPERLAGELAARSRPDCALTWNLEAPKNYYRGDAGRCLGHCWMLGTRGRLPGGWGRRAFGSAAGQLLLPIVVARPRR